MHPRILYGEECKAGIVVIHLRNIIAACTSACKVETCLMYESPAGTRGNICSHVVSAVHAMFIKVYALNV